MGATRAARSASPPDPSRLSGLWRWIGDTKYVADSTGFVYNLLMSKAGKQIIAGAQEALDTVRRARALYEAAGNDCWGLEDEITRLYYLRLAAQNAETKSPA